MRYINKNEPPAPSSLSLFTVLGVPLGVSPVPPHCFCFLNSPRVGLFAPSLLEAGLSAAIPHAPPIHSHSHSHSNFLFLPQFILFLILILILTFCFSPNSFSFCLLMGGHKGTPLQPTLPLRFPLPLCWRMQFAPTNPRSRSVSRSLYVGECNSPLHTPHLF